MSRDELKQTYDTDARMLKFTNNVVCLDLHDPDATDLSFVDLPGLIQNESQEAIDLVKDMVVSYIDRPNTLILVAMPMTDDVENQQAARLAREADPEGLRTIGVVTKPDCLPPGAIDSRRRWKDIFLGRAHQLNHGYYCVRLPDDSERARQASRADSAAIAAQFFRDTKPWKDVDMNQRRFGIPNLVSDVSRLLVELIERSLPLLKQQVQDLLDRCLDDINNLPPTITRDPQAEVFIRVNNFCREFADSVEARSQKHYVQGSRALYAQLKVDIRATTPDFRPYPNYAAHPTPLWQCDEDGDEVLSAGSDTESIPADSQARPIDLTDVRDVIKKSTGWELPGHVPYEATRHLIERHVKLWHHPAMRCFSDVFRALNAFMHGLQAEHFSRFRLLHEHVRDVAIKEMESRKKTTLVALEQLLAGESAPILTLNNHYYLATSKKWHSAYTQRWNRARSPPGAPSNAARLPTPIPYADEIQVMANVRAYFQVAYKRIIDGIPLAIERDLNRALAVSLNDALVQSLFEGPDIVSRMRNLISEDPGIEQRREELASRKGQLEEIRRRLEEMTQDCGPGDLTWSRWLGRGLVIYMNKRSRSTLVTTMPDYHALTSALKLAGTNVVVVGGTQGIGAGIALRLAELRASVLISGRNEKLGDEMVRKLKERGAKDARFAFARKDLGTIEATKALAEDIAAWAGEEGVQYLYLTQGGPVCFTPGTVETLTAGFNVQILSHFLIPYLLLTRTNPVLREGAQICHLGRPGEQNRTIDFEDFSGLKAAAAGTFSMMTHPFRWVFMIDVFTKEFNVKFPGTQTAHLYPGPVYTQLFNAPSLPWYMHIFQKTVFRWTSISTAKYADIAIWETVSDEAKALKRAFWDQYGHEVTVDKRVESDPEFRQRVWDNLLQLSET
ncbi:hypothetical protein EYR36_000047 [Pleurotus pulmonarius]|nr:hypothetical protein EYR36_000047 [Pleurotus pulmonarius]